MVVFDGDNDNGGKGSNGGNGGGKRIVNRNFTSKKLK
jgi:hypothetical protein